MLPSATRPACCVAVVVVLISGLLASLGAAPGAVASSTYCDPAARAGLTTYEWSGGSGDWSDPTRWPGGPRPGLTASSHTTDYVCIDAGGGTVTLDESINAVQLVAFDVAPGTTLLLDHGKLFVHGDPAIRPSVVRGRLELVTSYLGGPGLIRIDGRMRVDTAAGVSTITSDSCASGTPGGQSCPGLAGGPGELVVSPRARLDLDGARGLQLHHGFALTIRGVMSISGNGAFVSADRGTSVAITPGGRLVLRTDGGIYEGFDRGLPRRADLHNAGTIVKSAGAGVSALDVSLRSVGAGTIVVLTGSVTLPRGAARGVTVRAGSAFGTGTCRPGATRQCRPVVTGADDEFGRLTPSAQTGVTVVEGPVKESARDLGQPVIYSFGRGIASVLLAYAPELDDTFARLDVYRAGTRDGTYTRVRNCRGGELPAGVSTCVDRVRTRVRHSGGARIIVRTRVDGALVTRGVR